MSGVFWYLAECQASGHRTAQDRSFHPRAGFSTRDQNSDGHGVFFREPVVPSSTPVRVYPRMTELSVSPCSSSRPRSYQRQTFQFGLVVYLLCLFIYHATYNRLGRRPPDPLTSPDTVRPCFHTSSRPLSRYLRSTG